MTTNTDRWILLAALRELDVKRLGTRPLPGCVELGGPHLGRPCSGDDR